MKHRHLLPDEIDQLLDDELGFGMAPLKAHLSECDDCRGRYEDARAVTDLIDKLPHHVPSHRFAENVMSQVEVFVPWHVTALDSIAACESGGDPSAVSADGAYHGKYQFDYGTWASVGGSGDPATASEAEQDYRAALLYSRGGPSAWPICG